MSAGDANSHAGRGWEDFTGALLAAVGAATPGGVVYMLWGKPAQARGAGLDRSRNLVLEAPHPSPLSAHRGFLGCRHFSRANAYLVEQGRGAVNWAL